MEISTFGMELALLRELLRVIPLKSQLLLAYQAKLFLEVKTKKSVSSHLTTENTNRKRSLISVELIQNLLTSWTERSSLVFTMAAFLKLKKSLTKGNN
jgi:hypothetical protein